MPKQASRKDFRSISLPCRSHPSTHRIENVQNKVKTWESTSSLSNPSAEIICSGMSQLTELYECLDELLKTSSISTNQGTKWTDELLDVSVSLLDIFSNTSHLMLQTKQHVRDLGCDLRRKTGHGPSTINNNHIVFRQKMRKDIKRSVATLNQLDNMIAHSPFLLDFENHHLITSVIRVFREVKASTVVILRLLFKFLAVPLLKTRSTSRWTAVSRYLSKSNGKVAPEEKADRNANEFQSLDAALFVGSSTSYKLEFIQIIQKKLDTFEVTVDAINSHLELMSRRLIATRTSLLNLVSFY